MTRITEISQIYDRKLKEIRDPQKWEDMLKRASNFWKVSLCEAMLIIEQNPDATICGTLAMWNKCGRYIRRGEKSIAIFKSRTDTQLEYVFDISQTYGTAINAKWVMSENIADGIVGKYNAENSENADSLENFLKKALDKNIDLIYNYDSKLNGAISSNPRATALIVESAKCICFTRCGIECEYNFTDAAHLRDDISIMEIGNAASALAQEVLRDVDRIIRRKEYEQYEADVCGRSVRYPLRGEEWTEISDVRKLRNGTDVADGEKSAEYDERRGYDSARLYQYERSVSNDLGGDRRESGAGQADNGTDAERKDDTLHGLRSKDGAADGDRYSGAEHSVGNSAAVREMAVSGSAEQRGPDGDRQDTAEYDDDLIDTDEYDRAESDEDSAFPVYDGDQLTLFTEEPKYSDNGLFVGKHNRLALLEDEIIRGTGFSGGKFRVVEYVKNVNPTTKELAQFLKKEYGIGGHSGDGDIKFVDHDSKGIRIRIGDENAPDGVYNIRFTWYTVAEFTAELIESGEYISQEDINARIRTARHVLKTYKPSNEHDTFPIENAKSVLREYGLLDETFDNTEVGVSSETEELVRQIEEKYGDKDKFRINFDTEAVTAVYYNPDSSAGGQLVYTYFGFDDIDKALSDEDPVDYLYSAGRGSLVDITDETFVKRASDFLNEDVNSYYMISSSSSRVKELKENIELMRSFSESVNDRRIIRLAADNADAEPEFISENARHRSFSNLRLEYNGDYGYCFIADSEDEKDLVLRTYGDTVPAGIFNDLKKNGYIITGIDEPIAKQAPVDIKIENITPSKPMISADEPQLYVMLNSDYSVDDQKIAVVHGAMGNRTVEFLQNVSDEVKEYIERVAERLLNRFEMPLPREPRDGEPMVTIGLSEHPDIPDEPVTMPFSQANEILGFLDMQHTTREDKEIGSGWYKKTDFSISVDGETVYSGRYDLGDGEGSLLNHIRDYADYLEKNIRAFSNNDDELRENEARLSEMRDLVKTLEKYSIEYSKEASIDTNGDEVLVTDKEDHRIILDPADVVFDTNEGFLKAVADNNPEYAPYINAFFDKLVNDIEGVQRFLQAEANDVEHDRLVAAMAEGGFGDDPANSRAEQEIIRREARYGVENADRDKSTGVRNDFAPVTEETAPHNYRFPEDFSYSKGAKAKYADNVAAIKVLQTVERERRNATPDEQAVLARYSGWGGIADAFDESKDSWHSEYVELRSLLSDSEYKAARASTLTAFYTEPYIINSIYTALEHFGFKGGYILDPSMGTGNFFGNMPREMAENSRLFGVELDSLTSRIAKQLYPNADIRHKGFEQVKYADKTFDVVVGNVPFGDFKPYDPGYDDEYYIHDYFFIKSLDKLKAGGIAALITSNGTLDKYSKQARLEMYRRADLIGAIRLPNNAFKTAGTEAVTDILFFQKIDRERDIDSISEDKFPDWIKSNGVRIGDLWFNCNCYFGNHTENILGEMKKVSGPYGLTDTVDPYENGDLKELLNNAVAGLNARFYAEPTVEDLPEVDEKDELPKGVRPFTYFTRDGKLYFAETSEAAEYAAKDNKAQQRIIDMCGIAEQIDKVIAVQRDGCSDEQLKREQEILNDRYDRFVTTHGNLNDQVNRRLFQDDIRAPKLSALEIEAKNDLNETVYRKADIFSKRTVNQRRAPDHADSAIEALHISLNLRQCVDIGYMARLCGKSEDEVIDELGNNIYCNPVKNNGDKYSGWETAEEYLSGHTKEKLGLAMVKAEENPDFLRNVEALKEHQPLPIPITGIGFRLGSIFIPKEMFTQFMWETFETNMLHKSGVFEKDIISAEYISALNEWRIPNKTKEHSVKIDEMFGTSRINAYELTELILNQKRAEIKDRIIDPEGNEKYVLNRNETILAREKQRKIENAFREWVLSDRERIRRIEEIYNERYNSITPRQYDGSYIDVPGMSAGLNFMPHQKNAIARFAGAGCGLVAHEVGAGKTAFSAGLGMYLKSIGAITKPMYVVPNAVIGQFGEEFMRFFPEANILVANDKDFEKQNRRRFLAKISAGNYDAVIISQSQFEKIPLSLERQEEMYDRKINDLTLSIAEMKKDQGSRLSVKKLESQRKSLQKNIERLRAVFKKDDFITFEDLGCDYLIVDEAHNYKNLALFSKMHNVAGVNTSSNSQRAFDLECKVRYLQEINNGGGVILMTGTPISNAISEMFVWQYLLQYPRLKDLGIEYFDNWASVFGNITQALEVKPSGSGFRMRTRFSQFLNLPELCNIFGEITDIVKTSELDIALPAIAGGKPKMIICEKSPAQEEQTEIGLERARRIENKEVEPWEDNMPVICTYMTKVALDGRIIDPNAEDYEGSKVNKCIEEILNIDREYPNTAQVVFCDTNTPTNSDFSVYRDIKEKLISSGQYKPEEIAFIHDAKNDKQKVEMFAKINEAKIRVIIGSTQKLGTGVNIQQRLIALHHLDAPFRPSDIEQRNGRGIRQGNTNPEVFVNYYATKGTFDTYRWQLLEKKQAVTAQIMSGRPAARTCEDIDEVALTFAEMKAASTDNPLIAEKLTVDNEVARLTLLKNDYISQQANLADDVNVKYPKQIAVWEQRLKNAWEDIKTANNDPIVQDVFRIEIGGKNYYERPDAAKAIEAQVSTYMHGENFRAHEPVFIGKFHGFELGLKHTGNNELNILLKGENTYSSGYAYSGSGALTRFDNLFSKIPEQPKVIQDQIDHLQRQLGNAREMLDVPFEHADELNELLDKQGYLNMQLEFGESREDEIVDEDNDEGNSPEM